MPLDEVGTVQAKHTAEVLGDWLGGLPGELRLYSSDLARAAATAAPLAERVGRDVVLDRRLRETDAGQWQGLTAAEIEQRWPEEYTAWKRGDDVPLGGAERRSESGARAAACIGELEAAGQGGTVVCVSHGAALRGAICELTGIGWEGTAALEPIRNAHWTVMRRVGDRWRIVGYNLGVTAAPL